MASVDALLNQSLAEAKKGRHSEQDKAAREINKILTANIADLFKARGYLSSRLKRADDYWRGFEEDALLAGTQYARSMAAGFAKREAARNMTLAVTGRDISWSDWQEDNPNGTYEDYLEFARKRRIDPGKQKNLHKEAMSFMREVLRNEEQSDRIMGTLKGLAVLKFLGFRVSSAAVNATNMVQAVPATISSHSSGSLTQALQEVKRAAVKYGKYRSGKGKLSDEDNAVFLEITDRGWDEAQFNHDAAQVLRSKVGNTWDKFIGAGMYMFGAAEKANRAMTIFAAYKQFKKHHPEIGYEELMKKAKHASDRAHGVYGKETAPAWTRGSINPLKLAYTFQKFSHNYILNMGEMGMKGDKKQFAYMLLSPAVLAGAGASLATPILQAVFQALGVGGGDDPEEEFYQWAEDTFGSDRMFRHGLAGVMGINLKGSLQIHNPMPRNLKEVLGAPGAIFTDIYDAGGHFRKGELFKGGEKLLPTGIGSGLKAVREYKEGVTTGSYSPVYYGNQPLKGTAVDATLRFFSFNPSRLSGIREKQWREKKVASKYAKRKRDIYARIKHALISGDEITPEEWAEIDKLIQRYNEMVMGSDRLDIRPITGKTVRQVLRRAVRPGKRERVRGLELRQ
jgi:hypothetical protein